MKRPQAHRIDELAQRIFAAVLPPEWVRNEHKNDYGKDYLVEIGDGDELTGTSFYVQLKGQQHATINEKQNCVTFPLETRYAIYYLDRIQDLPVFLVVVDVTKKKAWWAFIQGALSRTGGWRRQNTVTIRLPLANEVSHTRKFRAAIESAKRAMRLNHPTSIHDAVAAHEDRIRALDHRFDVKTHLRRGILNFELMAREPVPLHFEFSRGNEDLEAKLTDLVERGEPVTFKPGEVKVTGSELFEFVEATGVTMRWGINVPATTAIVCTDQYETVLCQIDEIPGAFSGGRSELRYKGGLNPSPFTLEIGPITEKSGGPVRMKLRVSEWDRQPIRHLAYFDKLFGLFEALEVATITTVDCYYQGNRAFSGKLSKPTEASFAGYLAYLRLIHKARAICAHFGVNPEWSVAAFDQDTREHIEQLYAILFEGAWKASRPKLRLTATLKAETVNFDLLRTTTEPALVAFTGLSDNKWELLGTELNAGMLVYEFTEVRAVLSEVEDEANEDVPVAFMGTENTKMTIRAAGPDDPQPDP